MLEISAKLNNSCQINFHVYLKLEEALKYLEKKICINCKNTRRHKSENAFL